MAQWIPLGQRGDGPRSEKPLQPPVHEDVPGHLHKPLWDWLVLNVSSDVLGRITARVRADSNVLTMQAQRRKGYRWGVAPHVTPVEVLYELVGAQPAGLLDLADLVLAEQPEYPHTIGQIEAVLANGHSAWRVATDRRSLVRRISVPAVHVVEAAIAQAGPNAGNHLHAAWHAAFARQPDTTRAYSEAIKAVEAAAIPAVVPYASGKEKDRIGKATLSWVTRVLAGHREEWCVAIPPGAHGHGVDVVVAMVELLWEGQKDRHGGVHKTPPPPVETARAAVQLAVLLVQWFTDGTIRRR